MRDKWTLSQARQADYSALGILMYRAVREGKSPYTEAQRAAWMPSPRSGSAWDDRLGTQYVLIGKDSSKNMRGFMSLRPDGYVDFAYILPAARGQGLFRKLYGGIETRALEQGMERLSTHASIMAMPAFAAAGFINPAPETVDASGQSLTRFAMEKWMEKWMEK